MHPQNLDTRDVWLNSLGYLNGQWVDLSQMSLGIDDVGFLQGVTAVERLRTWHGRLPLIEEHLRRFSHTTRTLEIEGLPSTENVAALMEELLARNSLDSDAGIVVFATPGRRGHSTPTLGLHLSPLDFPRLDRFRRDGQPLVVSDVRQPPLDCWPRDIKVRCRVHYFLADQHARRSDPDALGVLIDDDGSITETSAANVLVLSDGQLRIPPAGRILPGVMLGAVTAVAREHGIAVERQRIPPQMLRAADEVLLSGTEAGVWPARKIDEVPKPPGPLCRQLQHWLQERLAE